MKFSNPLKWPEPFTTLMQESSSQVLGVFDCHQKILYANRGLLDIVGDDVESAANYLVNPTFEQLLSTEPDDEHKVFSGIATLGNGLEINISLLAHCFVENEKLIVYGEYDVCELNHLNNTVLDQNITINNLQREMI